MATDNPTPIETSPGLNYCQEQLDLLKAVELIAQEVVRLRSDELQAVINGEDPVRFPGLIRDAREKYELAKDALLSDIFRHGC